MFFSIKRISIYRWGRWTAVIAILLALGAGLYVRWDITGDWEGLYLLLGPEKRLTVTDDLFPEDAEYLVAGVAFTWLNKAVVAENCNAASGSCLTVRWDEKQGRGYVKNSYQDGRKLLVNLSRFKNEDGSLSSGIFVGGGLPTSDLDFRVTNKDETGMAYFDGNRWNHIWCNVNEAILSKSDINNPVYPQQWQFLGSRVLENSSNNITIVSQHRFVIDGVPIYLEKYFFYEVGDSYFTLITRVKNVGARPVAIYYLYGDEPWVGHYGTSKGNVGWLKGGLVKREEEVNARSNTFAGLLDYGNDLAGENHSYTCTANFIEWDKSCRPDMVYYSNHVGKFSPSHGAKAPLCSDTCRFIGLQWGPRTLEPKQAFSFTLAIGMAGYDPGTGFPIKPITGLN